MKIKLSKTLAVVLALCLTFAGFSAYAADVTITTSYDFTTMHEDAEGYNEATALAAALEVNAIVSDIAEGAEVTYYVTNDSEIVYVNQDSAEGGEVSFSFTTTWGKADGALVQFGSDAGEEFTAFTITEADNYKTSGTATVSGFTAESHNSDEGKGWKFTAKVSGNATEYGVNVEFPGEGSIDLPAMGCDEDGNFTVVVIYADGSAVPTEVPVAEAYAREGGD